MSIIQFGKYEVRRELGRGAMGTVYEARDPDRNLDVALKIMSPPAQASPDAVRRQEERFLREARALAALSHPLIVRLFDEGVIDGRRFFSMERVSGTTLRDRVRFQGPLSLPDLVRVASSLCDALEHVHSRGVIHRDVKPDNVMLLPDGSPKLMDFGIARMLNEQDNAVPMGVQGSPAYMSPEQASGAALDARSDLYSLAVTLYEAATGRRAFEGESIAEITHKVIQEYPTPPAGLPPHFQAALMRAMAKDAAYRYSRAREMAAALRGERYATFDLSPASYAPMPVYSLPPALFQRPQPPEAAGFILPDVEARAPSPAPQPISQSGNCRRHTSTHAAATCSSCGHAMCYTCFLEVPGRGIVCRSCAFGG